MGCGANTSAGKSGNEAQIAASASARRSLSSWSPEVAAPPRDFSLETARSKQDRDCPTSPCLAWQRAKMKRS